MLLPLATLPAAHASDLSAGRVLSCGGAPRCRHPPGPPDVDARPFGDTLGRPCGYRERATPSGTRRVRVCY